MNSRITGIWFDGNTPPLLLIFYSFKKICLTTLSDGLYPHLNKLHLMVSKFLTFHENTELIPSSDCYELSLGNKYPIEPIKIFPVGIPVRNKLFWVEVAKEDRAWGTNVSSIFFIASETFDTADSFSSVKIALAAPKKLYPDTYEIFFNSLSYARSIKWNDQNSERTSAITSAVLKLSPSCTDSFLLAKFSQICWMQLVLIFIWYIYTSPSLLVKYECNRNPWGTWVRKYIPKVQSYKNIWIYRKGRSQTLKEHNF